MTVEDGADGFEHRAHRQIRQESESSLIDADQRHIKGRKGARDVEHGAVAADDDGKVGFAAGFFKWQDGMPALADVGGGERIQQYPDVAPTQEIGKLQQWRSDFRALVFAD